LSTGVLKFDGCADPGCHVAYCEKCGWRRHTAGKDEAKELTDGHSCTGKKRSGTVKGKSKTDKKGA
jgi:hypothetical protein